MILVWASPLNVQFDIAFRLKKASFQNTEIKQLKFALGVILKYIPLKAWNRVFLLGLEAYFKCQRKRYICWPSIYFIYKKSCLNMCNNSSTNKKIPGHELPPVLGIFGQMHFAAKLVVQSKHFVWTWTTCYSPSSTAGI